MKPALMQRESMVHDADLGLLPELLFTCPSLSPQAALAIIGVAWAMPA